MPSQRDIEVKQQYLINLGQKIQEEEDPNVILEIAKIMEAEATELQAMCLAFEAEMEKQYPPQERRGFDVVLTPGQRERVYKETGIKMETLFVDDPEGSLNASMIFM